MTRYLPPPTPGPECDTAQAVREFYDDVARAEDELPTPAEILRDEAGWR